MRIGIDLLALQSPGSRRRGVGRFGENLVSGLLALNSNHQFIFYQHAEYPPVDLDCLTHDSQRWLKIEPSSGERTIHDAIDRLVRRNPDDLNLLLTLNPFELCPGYDPPAKPLNGLKVAALVHDLIPFLYPEQYLSDPPNANWFYRRLRTIQGYDLLLTNSEATRLDCLRVLQLPDHRVVRVGGSADRSFFHPPEQESITEAERDALRQLGVVGSFLLHVGGRDDRKNVWGCLDAFASLPERRQSSHQLVIVGQYDSLYQARIRAHAHERGIAPRLILAGVVADETLRLLYQRCSAFVFPSHYEGLGLPLLEAMHCGAAVVAGNNSSQIEVVETAGCLVAAHDSDAIARALEAILTNPQFARTLGHEAQVQASRFSWNESASRALHALTTCAQPQNTQGVRNLHARRLKPRIALFSPLPPKRSGISEYSVRLLEELKHIYTIDLYHDTDYVPDLGLFSSEFGCFDYRLYERRASQLDYRGVVYQMGNSWYHKFIYETLLYHPGVVTMHDFSLSGFLYWYANLATTPPRFFEHQLEHDNPEAAADAIKQLPAWHQEPGGIQLATTRRGWFMNRRVFERAAAVIVHSPWCREQVRKQFQEHLARTFVVPMGAIPRRLSDMERSAIRAQFEIPQNALVFGSFGILSSGKMNVETLDAFAEIARSSRNTLLLFVGEDWENGEARAHVDTLGLRDRVRFLGRQADDAFADLVAITDIGISLRRPPTYGETSASLLDLLRAGVATIVTNVGTFADYPDHVVRKVHWDREGPAGLVQALRELSESAQRRTHLGRAALEHIEAHHGWSNTADQYVEIIERVHAERHQSARSA